MHAVNARVYTGDRVRARARAHAPELAHVTRATASSDASPLEPELGASRGPEFKVQNESSLKVQDEKSRTGSGSNAEAMSTVQADAIDEERTIKSLCRVLQRTR